MAVARYLAGQWLLRYIWQPFRQGKVGLLHPPTKQTAQPSWLAVRSRRAASLAQRRFCIKVWLAGLLQAL